jgi:hypothetical protein
MIWKKEIKIKIMIKNNIIFIKNIFKKVCQYKL